MPSPDGDPTIRVEITVNPGNSRVQDAQVIVSCSRDHGETYVARLVRQVDAPPLRAPEFPAHWLHRAVSDESLDLHIQDVNASGRPSLKMRIRCTRCGFDLQRDRQTLQKVLDTLAENGIRRITLEQLARRVG